MTAVKTALYAASDGVMRVEKALAGALGVAVAVLILLNVVTRAANMALYWVDETAVYAMVWLGFIGASLTIRMRIAVAVTLLWDAVPAGVRHLLIIGADAAVLLFAVALAVMTWNWFDPLALASAGFDFGEFQAQTFNFVYDEPTTTLGIKKFWVWLVVPWTCATMTLHALANLVEDLSAAPSAEPRAVASSLE